MPLDDQPHYRLPAWFHKSLVVFILHRARELAKEQGLILVEGRFDWMKVWQAGFRNVVSLLGSSWSDEPERLILDAGRPRAGWP
jgi:DNA primase